MGFRLKRGIALTLTTCMLATMMPQETLVAFAAESESTSEESTGEDLASSIIEHNYEGVYDWMEHAAWIECPDNCYPRYGLEKGVYNLDSIQYYTDIGVYTVYYGVYSIPDDTLVKEGTLTVTISKESAGISFGESSISMSSSSTKEVSYSHRAWDGTMTIESSDESIVTATADNSWITCTAGKAGTATITVRVTGSEYFADDEASFSVTVKKGYTFISLQDKTAYYNGSPISASSASVWGTTGAVTYVYYKDSECTVMTTEEDGAEGIGMPPANPGEYYVVATAEEDESYAGATATALLSIKGVYTSIALDQTYISMAYGESAEVGIQTVHDGVISVVSSDERVATATIEDGKVVVYAGSRNGTTILTITAAASSKYSAVSTTLRVENTTTPTIVSLNATHNLANTQTITGQGQSPVGAVVAYYVSYLQTYPAEDSDDWIPTVDGSFTHTAARTGTYYFWVKDVAGNVSERASISVTDLVALVSSIGFPSTESLVLGKTKELIATFNGKPKSVVYESADTNIVSIDENGKITALAYGDTAVRVVVTNYDDSVVSATCLVEVISAPPTITKQPQYNHIGAGTEVQLSVTATGVGLRYQWYVSDDSLGTGVMVPGATEAVCTLAAESVTGALNGKYYYCKVTNENDASITSSRAMLAVYDSPTMPELSYSVDEDGWLQAPYVITVSGSENYGEESPITYYYSMDDGETWYWSRYGEILCGGDTAGTTLMVKARLSRYPTYESPVATALLKRDCTPPFVSQVYYGTEWKNGCIPIGIYVTDELSGVEACGLSFSNEEEPTEWVAPDKLVAYEPGAQYVWARDVLGNVSCTEEPEVILAPVSEVKPVFSLRSSHSFDTFQYTTMEWENVAGSGHITAYYAGSEEPTAETEFKYVTQDTTRASLDVTAPGTYYFAVKDATGCISETQTVVYHTVTVDRVDDEEYDSYVAYVADGYEVPLATFTREGYSFAWENKDGEIFTDSVLVTGDEVLQTHWTPLTYTITYDLDGGTLEGENPSEYTIESEDITLLNPTKENYEFTGWYEQYQGSYVELVIPTGSMGNRHFTARWSRKGGIPYTVRHYYQSLDGSYALYHTSTYSALAGESVTPSTILGDVGYTTPETQTVSVKEDGSTVVDYYYDRKSFTLETVCGRGVASMPGAGTYLYGEHVSIPCEMLDGYRFAGYECEYTRVTVDFDKQTLEFDMPPDNLTISAYGEPIEYQIVYHAGGGHANFDSDLFTVESAPLPAGTATRVGYDFAGWAFTEGGEPMTDYCVPTGTVGNVHLYAVWIADTDSSYTVKHYCMNLDGTTYSCVKEETLAGASDEVVTPEVKDYEGFTSPEPQQLTISAYDTVVCEYYYTRNKYTVEVSGDNGIDTLVGAGEYFYGDTVTVSATAKAGYSAEGLTVNDGELLAVSSYKFSMGTQPVAVYASTTPIAYRLVYELDGGSVVEGNPSTYTIEDSFVLNNPIKQGYNFVGWSDGTSVQSVYEIAQGTTGNKTLYAQFSPWDGVPYAVEHYTMGLDGEYSLLEREQLYGTADATVAPSVKELTGFTSPTVQESTITPDGSLVVQYYYMRDKYTVEVSGDAGVASIVGTGDYYYGDTVSISVVLKDGYEIDVWSDTTFGQGVTAAFSMGAADCELSVSTKLTEYTITYDLAGGYVDGTNPGMYNVESATFTLVNPTRANYEFLGWTKNGNEEFAESLVTVPTGSFGNLTFKAVWALKTDITYTVDYYVMGLDGVYSKDSSVKFLADAGAEITPVVPEREGFVSPKAQTVSVSEDGDTVVSYYYERCSYSLTAGATKGVSISSTLDKYLYGQPVSITATLADGYAFSGWEGLDANRGTELTFTMPAEDLDLTANATPVVYSVTYDLAGGRLSGAPTSYTVESVDRTIGVPTRNGYVFKGWLVNDADEPVMQYEIPVGEIGDLHLTAIWERETYSYLVEHYLMGLNGVDYELQTTEQFSCVGDTTVRPAVKSYTGFSSPAVQEAFVDSEGLIVRYFYTRERYTITVRQDAGVASVEYPESALYGETVTVRAESATGYTISDVSGSTGGEYEFVMPAEPAVLAVHARANVCEIVYQNGNTVLKGSTSAVYGKSATLMGITDLMSIPVGYSFAGWSFTKGASKADLADKAKSSTGFGVCDTGDASITLYAVFTKNPLKSQSITGVKSSVTRTLGDKAFSLSAKASGETKVQYKSSNSSVVKVSSAGKVTIKGVGTATITITASQSAVYKSATKTVTITVNPKATKLTKAAVSKKKVALKWKKVTGVTGYEVQYSVKKNFKGASIYTAKKVSALSKTLTLKSKKTYYVRVRTYKTVGGKKYYSAWCSLKEVKTK